jgi:hypothetical protein
MLSMQDVLDYCDLERGEIEAIAEHEQMIIENMQHALDTGHNEHVQALMQTYEHLQRTHPLPTRH